MGHILIELKSEGIETSVSNLNYLEQLGLLQHAIGVILDRAKNETINKFSELEENARLEVINPKTE
jgi:hypothetical protein